MHNYYYYHFAAIIHCKQTPVLAGTPVKNGGFAQATASAFGLWRRCFSFQWWYVHSLCTIYSDIQIKSKPFFPNHTSVSILYT